MMSPHDPNADRASLPLVLWQSKTEQQLLEIIQRHVALVREVVFIQPGELHLPNALRRATEVIGPASFRVDLATLPPELIDQVSSVAHLHPLEVWYRISSTGRLAHRLRTAFPSDKGPPELREGYLAELEIIVDRLPAGELWFALPPSGTHVVILGHTTIAPEVAPPGLSSDDVEAVRNEIDDLHHFFVAWFTGALPDTDAAFSRFELAMAHDFELIDPRGELVDLPTLSESLRHAHCSRTATEFTIRTEEVRVRSIGRDFVVATYEERQHRAGTPTVRLSTALLRLNAAGTPRGVEWRHVHETWKIAPPSSNS